MAGMFLPVEGKYYLAEEGKGCFLDDTRLQLGEDVSLEDSLIAYSFDFSKEEGKTRREMELVERLSGKVRNIRSTNSLMDFCLTLEGKLGAAINQTTRIWDIAAPWLMFREAGGKARDLKGKHILFDLSPEAIEKNYTIVAAGREIHEALIRIIQIPTE
jgi:myo-inositol-1(or 4)-monophosphatase